MAVKITLSSNESMKKELALEKAKRNARRRQGYFTIAEAVKLIQRRTGAKNIRQGLMDAVSSGIIVAYDPDTFEKYRLGVTRDFHEVLRSIDLNDWLKNYQKGLNYEFQEPNQKISGKTKSVCYENNKAWFEVNSNDPIAEQDWYTAARYFARKLVEDDPALLHKRSSLAEKTAKSLKDVGIFKRGGKLPPKPETILKAFSNISLG